MKYDLPVQENIIDVVGTLQRAGFESYIVGGAIRDLLLGRRPKDYDLSTAATPEEIREVFGRRRVRIIGKRFRLAHLHLADEIIEVSTFRATPPAVAADEKAVVSNNDYGTATEDAWRRDFTINALFYDPVSSELIDYTGKGLDDIENGVVRAIGDAKLRFEEDPVRLLRALKLVGQYDFSLDAATENALFAGLPLIRNASPSRLSLELEKVLSSCFGDRHLRAFHDYGFLKYFLPFFNERWGGERMEYALDLLTERNFRVDEGAYRNSISMAIAALALPFVEEAADSACGELWPVKHSSVRIKRVLETIFAPQKMMRCMEESAERVLAMQPDLVAKSPEDDRLIESRSYAHARELALIQNRVMWHDEELEEFWPPGYSSGVKPKKKPSRRRGGRAKIPKS
jgi:poly(A) polymerase